jgi:hypothetical protein
MDYATLLVVHAVPTLCLVGLIWFVQQVHYALYSAVGAEAFAAYERAHCRRVTPLVLPLMLTELGAAVAVWWHAPDAAAHGWALAGLVLLAIVWGSTFWLQVPCHRRLERSADPRVMARLVAGNWLRTCAWTLRGAVAVRMLLPATH